MELSAETATVLQFLFAFTDQSRNMKQLSIRTRKRRGAILTMELVLVLPIFMLLIFSLVEFSLLMSARTRISDAARSGARVISVSGGSTQDVQAMIVELLGTSLSQGCRIDIQPSQYAGGVGNVHIQVPMKNASPDLLWMTGFSVSERFIHVDAPMVMERHVASEELQRM